MTLRITHNCSIDEAELEITAVSASGPGGQHVNRTASAIHLRFDVEASSIPNYLKQRILQTSSHLLTDDGVVIIKSQEHRSQHRNREAALARLVSFLQGAVKVQKARKKTRPTLASKRRRLEAKKQRGRLKSKRGKVSPNEI